MLVPDASPTSRRTKDNENHSSHRSLALGNMRRRKSTQAPVTTHRTAAKGGGTWHRGTKAPAPRQPLTLI